MPGLRGARRRPAAVGMAGPCRFLLPCAHRTPTQGQTAGLRVGAGLNDLDAAQSGSDPVLCSTDALASGQRGPGALRALALLAVLVTAFCLQSRWRAQGLVSAAA